MLEFVVIASSILALSFCFWIGYHAGSSDYKTELKNTQVKMFKNDSSWRKLASDLEQQVFELTETFEARLERQTEERVFKKIRSWEPDLPSIQEDFKRAEAMADYMAKKRQMLDAGRFNPPREDQQGEPAVVRRISTKRPKK